jgi:adenosine kinase
MVQKQNLPGQVAFMGCIGANDDYGKQLEACATADGVCVHYMKDATTPTGTCAALILGGERALVANLAAANNFKPSHLATDKAQELVQSAQFYYSAGFFLTVSVESMVQVAQHAVEHGKTYCLNLSAPFIVDFFADQMAQVLEYADFLFGNESEAAAYGKKHGIVDKNDENPDLAKIAMHIAGMPKKGKPGRTVVFTQGSKSTIVVRNGVVTEYKVEELAKEKLVDTNGAGDAFVGGFLSQLVSGKENDMDACVKAGHWAARYIIQTSGTTLDGPCEYTA